MRMTALLGLLACTWAAYTAADAKDGSVDDVMAKIFAADVGQFRGEAHFRSLSGDAEWTTAVHHVTCLRQDSGKIRCDGKTGDQTWMTLQYYSGGIQHVEGGDGGNQWKMEYRIVDPWYFDDDNFGYGRTWAMVNKGVEYEGMDTFIQMGDRGTIHRKIRIRSSGDGYRYTLFEVFDRVDAAQGQNPEPASE